MNGIHHITTAVHKPSTNGQCERVVQIVKSALKQARLSDVNPTDLLPTFLLRYRVTPHSTTGESPSKLLMGRQLRTRLDLLRPSVNSTVQQKQRALVESSKGTMRSLNIDDSVRTHSYYGNSRKWVLGVIERVLGNRHYIVNVSGNKWKRHIDQIITSESTNNSNDISITTPIVPNVCVQNSSAINDHDIVNTNVDANASNVNDPAPIIDTGNIPDPVPVLRRSGRVSKPPDYLKDFTK